MDPKVEKNLEEWLENPRWRKYWEEAPSEKCREQIALEFHYSEYELDETAAMLDRIEEELSLEDWRYLLKECGNNPRRKIIQSRIAALGGE